MLAQPAAPSVSDSAAPPARRLILANPHSFRLGRGDRMARIEQLARSHQASLEPVRNPEDIAACLTRHRPGREDVLIIIGGDGTLQAVVSQLADRLAEADFPSLLMLGGGRTNFTARDLDSHARMLPSLARILGGLETLGSERRPVLRVRQAGQPDRYGFFVAGALVDHVIRDCHRYRERHRDWLRTGHPSSAWRVAQLALLGLVGRSDYRPPELRLDSAQLGTLEGPMRIVLLTTLMHRSGWLDPYAERGQGTLRLTAIGMRARGFWPALPRLLRGRFGSSMQPANGYLSGRSESIRIVGLPSICLDGQEFSLDPAEPLLVDSGPVFRFLRP